VECLLPIPYTPLWGDAFSVVESRGFYKVRLFGIYRVSLMVRRRRVRFSQSEWVSIFQSLIYLFLCILNCVDDDDVFICILLPAHCALPCYPNRVGECLCSHLSFEAIFVIFVLAPCTASYLILCASRQFCNASAHHHHFTLCIISLYFLFLPFESHLNFVCFESLFFFSTLCFVVFIEAFVIWRDPLSVFNLL